MSKSTVPALQEAMLALMREKKLNTITVEELAVRANVNKKTVYYHFDGITGVLCSIFEKWVEDRIDDRELLPETWMQVLEEVTLLAREHTYFFKSIGSSRYAFEFRNFEESLSDRYVEAFIHKTLDLYRGYRNVDITLTKTQMEYIVQFYSKGYTSVIRYWFENGMKESNEELVHLLYIFNRDNLYRTFDEILGLEPKILL